MYQQAIDHWILWMACCICAVHGCTYTALRSKHGCILDKFIIVDSMCVWRGVFFSEATELARIVPRNDGFILVEQMKIDMSCWVTLNKKDCSVLYYRVWKWLTKLSRNVFATYLSDDIIYALRFYRSYEKMIDLLSIYIMTEWFEPMRARKPIKPFPNVHPIDGRRKQGRVDEERERERKISWRIRINSNEMCEKSQHIAVGRFEAKFGAIDKQKIIIHFVVCTFMCICMNERNRTDSAWSTKCKWFCLIQLYKHHIGKPILIQSYAYVHKPNFRSLISVE